MNEGARKESWGIIGGGIMGMALAQGLAVQGKQVCIMEAAPQLGGLTAGMDMHGLTWDAFYHVILLSDANTRELIGELGLEEEMRWVETRTGFYTGGSLHSMSNLIEYFRFPHISLIGKFRLGMTIVLASRIRNWKRMESIPVETWLRRWSGKKVFRNIWLPLLKAKLGEHYRDTSASFIWATIQRMYAARRSGLKKEMFGYMHGGYARILEHYLRFLQEKGVDIRTSARVSHLAPRPEGGLEVILGDGERLGFDRVISTLAPDLSVKLAPDLDPEERKQHEAIRTLGVICPSLLMKEALSEYYITNITDAGPPFTGLIEMTALVDPEELKGHHLLYLPKYLAPEDPLFRKSDEELIHMFREALLNMYPDLDPEQLLHWSVARASRVFALPTLHYSTKLPGVFTSLPGYYIINSAQIINGTLNVNESLRTAQEKLVQILEHE